MIDFLVTFYFMAALHSICIMLGMVPQLGYYEVPAFMAVHAIVAPCVILASKRYKGKW